MIDQDLDGDEEEEELDAQLSSDKIDELEDLQDDPRVENQMNLEDEGELEDDDDLEGEDMGEGMDDFDNMVLPADLIAAAQEMDMKLDPAQIK